MRIRTLTICTVAFALALPLSSFAKNNETTLFNKLGNVFTSKDNKPYSFSGGNSQGMKIDTGGEASFEDRSAAKKERVNEQANMVASNLLALADQKVSAYKAAALQPMHQQQQAQRPVNRTTKTPVVYKYEPATERSEKPARLYNAP